LGESNAGGDAGRGGFSTTSWSLVEAARADGPESQAALAALAGRYWQPVNAYLRRRGISEPEAADLTQGFFSDVILGRRLFELADASRGRLRSLLLAALRNYLVDMHRRGRGRAKGKSLPLPTRERPVPERSNGTASREMADVPDPVDAGSAAELEFDRGWAQATLEEALSRCRRHLVQHGREQQWRVFERCVLSPAISGNRPPTTKEAARELGFESAAKLVAANQSVRLRVQMHLREVVAETADDPEDRLDEYRRLVELLTPPK